MIQPYEGELALTLRQISHQAELGNEPELATFAFGLMQSLVLPCGLCKQPSISGSNFCQSHDRIITRGGMNGRPRPQAQP